MSFRLAFKAMMGGSWSLGSSEFKTKDANFLLFLTLLMAAISAAYMLVCGHSAGFSTVQGVTGYLPGWFWESVTALGDERMLLALAVPFCLRYPKLLWAIVLTALIGGLISRGLKLWVYLPRPAALLPSDEITIIGHKLMGRSFPSGHTVSVFAFVGVWIALLGQRSAVFLIAAASVVGLSRVAVGAHWPADTLVGASIGLFSAWAGLELAKVWRFGEGKPGRRFLAGLVIIAIATLPFDGQGYPGSFPVRFLFTCWGISLALLAHLEWRDSRGVFRRPRQLKQQALLAR